MLLIRPLLILISFISFFGVSVSKAYVENVTHGYPSCVACHASPAGGNMLTDYGRSLSKELMSTWGGWKGSEQPLWGAFKAPKKYVRLGGDFRSIQTFVDSPFATTGKLFVMQNNFELGLKYKKFTLVTAFGTRGGPPGTPNHSEFISERHYLLWETSPTSRLRVGKFRQMFGINDPNHTRRVKSLLGFGSLSETYNLEFTQIYEKMEISVNASLGRIDRPRDGSEKNVSVTYAHYLNGKSRLGGSFLLGESDNQRRWVLGAFGVIPITEKLLTVFEVDAQQATPESTPNQTNTTFVGQARLAYNLFKGVLPYFVVEASSQSAGSENAYAPGLGIQWFPIPHVELHLEYLRWVNDQSPGGPIHVGWVQLHLYPW